MTNTSGHGLWLQTIRCAGPEERFLAASYAAAAYDAGWQSPEHESTTADATTNAGSATTATTTVPTSTTTTTAIPVAAGAYPLQASSYLHAEAKSCPALQTVVARSILKQQCSASIQTASS